MRKLLLGLAAAAAAAVAACDNSITGTTPAEDAGNYVLRSMNDSTLPYLYVATTTSQLYILSDTIFVGVDGRFTDRTHTQVIENGVSSFRNSETSGKWSEKGATVAFQGDDGSLITASFVGKSLVVVGDGRRATYTR